MGFCAFGFIWIAGRGVVCSRSQLRPLLPRWKISRTDDASRSTAASCIGFRRLVDATKFHPHRRRQIRIAAAASAASRQDATGQQPAVVDRIIFLGNRRIRSDTLKARIFSREGDPYNEETLRRDFQALWNTQFFEDVKLRIEDSPDGPNHKNVIFEVKERPVIRRIRYDGIHSISESDILDRFKEKKGRPHRREPVRSHAHQEGRSRPAKTCSASTAVSSPKSRRSTSASPPAMP